MRVEGETQGERKKGTETGTVMEPELDRSWRSQVCISSKSHFQAIYKLLLVPNNHCFMTKIVIMHIGLLSKG